MKEEQLLKFGVDEVATAWLAYGGEQMVLIGSAKRPAAVQSKRAKQSFTFSSEYEWSFKAS